MSGTRCEVTAPVVGWVPSPHSSLISSPQACHGARTLLCYKGSEIWSLSQQDESEDKNTAVGDCAAGTYSPPLVGWGEFSHGLTEGAVDSSPLLSLWVTLKGRQRGRTSGTMIPGGPRRSFQAAGWWRDGVDAPFSACPGLWGGKTERPGWPRAPVVKFSAVIRTTRSDSPPWWGERQPVRESWSQLGCSACGMSGQP